MISEELESASGLLKHALEQYTKACSAIQRHPVSRVFFDQLTTELLRFPTYEKTIIEAKTAISLIQNYSSPLTTINSLPSEILLRVFRHLLDTQDCYSERRKGAKGQRLLKDIDPFSHVCSRWRQIMLKSRQLWTHIDLAPRHYQILARARTYVARTDDLALNVHVIDPTPSSGNSSDVEFIQFLASIATQIRSLEIVTRNKPTSFRQSILQTCFTECVPGVLTGVKISDESLEGYSTHNLQMIESVEAPHDPASMLLDVSRQRLEEVWLLITSLRLNGPYPCWTSKAYHGLVELSLTAHAAFPTPLPESQLLDILRSSPGLRILRLVFRPSSWLADDAAVEPARLDYLELLFLGTTSFDRLGNFLRLIAPGSKELDVSFHLPHGFKPPTPTFEGQARRFFARSNVTRLQIRASWKQPWLAQVLAQLPRLKTLTLTGFHCDRNFTPIPTTDQDNPPNFRCIDTLNAMFGKISLVGLRRIIEKHSIQSITFWNCKFSLNGETISDEHTIKNNLSDICPTVQLLAADQPGPVEGWNQSA